MFYKVHWRCLCCPNLTSPSRHVPCACSMCCTALVLCDTCLLWRRQMYLTAEIDLHPSHFGTKLKATVRQRLMKEKEGTSVDQYGYVVYVVAIDDEDIGAGVVDSTTGYAKFVVRYLALLFRPFKNEVCDAVVQSVSTVCVHVGSRRLLQALGLVAWPSVTLLVLATVGLLCTAWAIQCVLHAQRKWRVQWKSFHVVRMTTGRHPPVRATTLESRVLTSSFAR